MSRKFTKEHYGRFGNPNCLGVLISYEYLRRSPEDKIARILTDPRVELLLDSGGFSALNAGKEIDLKEYITFLKKWEKYLFGYMQLDILGDPVGSDRYLQTMLDAGLSPIPIHVFGDNGERMDKLFEWSPLGWVALGGFRRPHRGPAPVEYVKQKMEWADGRNVHWLGYTNKEMVAGFRPYSVDSSTASSSLTFGKCGFYFGKGQWDSMLFPGKADNKRKKLSSRHINCLERIGLTIEDFHHQRQWSMKNILANKFVPGFITFNSFVRMSMEMRSILGIRYYLAVNPNNFFSFLEPQLEIEKIGGI